MGGQIINEDLNNFCNGDCCVFHPEINKTIEDFRVRVRNVETDLAVCKSSSQEMRNSMSVLADIIENQEIRMNENEKSVALILKISEDTKEIMHEIKDIITKQDERLLGLELEQAGLSIIKTDVSDIKKVLMLVTKGIIVGLILAIAWVVGQVLIGEITIR